MKKSVLRKVRRLEALRVRKETKGGLKTYGPYWQGVWYENGVEKKVHLGREIPESLKYLMEGRYKRRGYKNYTWPGE